MPHESEIDKETKLLLSKYLDANSEPERELLDYLSNK